MTSQPQKFDSGKNLVGRSPEVDFAVVLSRVIESIQDDPAQLRNAVYELARIKLRREASRRNPAINFLEARRLTLALESAIERVETIHSKHDELRALQSLYRLIEGSEIGASEVMIEPREPLLIVKHAPAQTVDADHLPVLLARAKGASLNVERSLHWPGAAPLLRGALVAIFAVALCMVLSQSGLLGTQAPRKAAPTVQKNEGPEPKPVVQAPELPLSRSLASVLSDNPTTRAASTAVTTFATGVILVLIVKATGLPPATPAMSGHWHLRRGECWICSRHQKSGSRINLVRYQFLTP